MPAHTAEFLHRAAWWLLGAAAFPLTAAAQERPAPPDSAGGADDLAQRVVDPTQPLTAVNFKSSLTSSFHGADGSATTQQFQPVIPLAAFGRSHILRTTVNFSTSGPQQRGLSDVTLFDLIILPRAWGRMGLGPLVQMVPRRDGSELLAGAALGATAKRGRWTIGAFNQNLFSGRTQLTQLQPILAFQLGNGYVVSPGESQFTWDWKRNTFVNLPLGVQLTKVTRLGRQPVRLSIDPEYNLRTLAGTPRFQVRLGFGVIAPSA